MISADFDLDGSPDLVTTDWNRRPLSLLINDGDGPFESLRPLDHGNYLLPIHAADLDEDGDPDLLVPHEDGVLTILLNRAID